MLDLDEWKDKAVIGLVGMVATLFGLIRKQDLQKFQDQISGLSGKIDSTADRMTRLEEDIREEIKTNHLQIANQFNRIESQYEVLLKAVLDKRSN
jgi:hypothetical protein